MRETLLDVGRVAQPSPRINEGGDCFACAAAAVSGYLGKSLTAQEANDLFPDSPNGGKSSSWTNLEQAFWSLRHDHDVDLEMRWDMAGVEFDPRQFSYGWLFQLPGIEYVERLEAWLNAGWVALTEINYDGAGPVTDFLRNATDHVVVLDGTRLSWVEHEGGSSSYEGEVHVVCSAKGAYWMEHRELNMRYGAAGWLLVRKDER